MAKITLYDNRKRKQNLSILKEAWVKFMSLDKFTRGTTAVIAIFAFLTPIIGSNSYTTTLYGHASTPLATPPAIYYGVSADWTNDLTPVAKFENDSGKQVSIVAFYTAWQTKVSNFNTPQMDAIRNHGSIPMIMWTLPTGVDTRGQFSHKSLASGYLDSYATQFATDAKNWGHPFFLEFDPYANCELTYRDTTTDLIKAWQHVHDIFTNVGVTNVTWVWLQNARCNNSGNNSLASEYPGNSYVDWTGISGDNFEINKAPTTWQNFSDLFSKSYADLQAIAPNKPIVLMLKSDEPTSSAFSKAVWITDAYSTQLPNNFPQIKAVIWDNSIGNHYEIDSSPESLQAFSKAVSSSYYMSNKFNNIIQSPIPPVGEFSHPSADQQANPSTDVSQ